jgi:hypothetical protein
MSKRDLKVVVRHLSGVSQAVADIIRNERELEKLIAGEDVPDPRQITAVVEKLKGVMADYLQSGKPLKISLTQAEALSTVEAAMKEAEGQPSAWPDGADARAFFIHGLYDELIQQPSNIFETKVFPDGTERYIPISRSAWKLCLERLRVILTAG